jgi:nucleoside-diphosphate-sugar epimerase
MVETPIEVFRLTGIYGNERNILSKLFAGNYKSVAWEPAHYSNRIHVDDITAALLAAMLKPQANRTINLSDDEPCSHAEYTTELAKHIGAPAPIILSPEEATQQLSPAYLDFFRDNKRISNQKLHQDLLPELKYPSFRNAISALLRANND